jgi:hypothetical protein
MIPGHVGCVGSVLLIPKLSTTENTGAAKVAVTACAAFMFTLQTPVPEQAPLQPVNVDPAPALAVSATVPLANVVEQMAPQLIPAGLLVTVPVPVTETVSGKVVTALTTAR